MSIASRIESIEEHIGNAYDGIEALGVDITDVDKNIENISTSIDGIFETLPKVTGEGESITLDGTIKGRLKTTLKGNTSQNGTPTPDTPIPVNVVSGDNTITISSIVPQRIGGYLASSSGTGIFKTGSDDCVYFPVISGHTYKYSSTGNRSRSAIFTNIPTNDTYPIEGTYLTTTPTTFTASATGYMVLYINTPHDQSVVDTFSVYDTSYYTTYPINLPVDNLFDGTQVTTTNPSNWGVTFENNVLTIEHKTAYSSGAPNIVLGTLPSGNYTISYTSTNRMSLYIDGVYDQLLDNGETFTAESGKTYAFYFSVADNSTVTFTNIMLEKGSKVNSYTPYGTTPMELCKIPNTDYEDTFIYDKTLDKWYWHKATRKITFVGDNENWSETTNYYQSPSVIDRGKDTELALTNYFTRSTSGGFDMVSLYFRIYDKTTFPTLADLKTWLRTHNVDLYYGLETPTDIEITYQPLIEQLNNIEKAMSYNGQTNISQVNNDLPFIISASALKEWSE